MKNTKLKRFKQYQEKRNRKNVLDTLNILKESTPSKIFEFIDLKSEEEAKDFFQKNNISFTSEKIEKKKKEFSMSIRTVKSILEKLTYENLVIHKKGGNYSLNQSLNKFVLFPNDFGESMVYSIGNFHPTTIEKSLEEFVNRYGLFMIFAFLQLLYLKSSKENGNESFSYRDEEEIDNNWLEDGVPLKLMFDLFARLYSDNKESTKKTVNLKILNGLNKIIETKYPLYYREFNDKIKENKELIQIIQHRRKDFTNAINEMDDEMDEFFDKAEREKIVLNKYKKKSKSYRLPTIYGDRAYARVLPKDWEKQIAKLSKESY